MPQFTVQQVAQIYYLAGFRGEALAVMVAVSRGESSWNADARGDVGIQDAKWGPSIGLSQIRSLKSATGTGKWRDADSLTDPYFNARAAFAISSGGTNFAPWTVFKNRSYQNYLADARAVVADKEVRGAFDAAANDVQLGGVSASPTGRKIGTSAVTEQGPLSFLDDFLEYARENFGWVAGFLEHDELGGLIVKATFEQWTFAKLEAALKATDYWQGTDAAVRDFDVRRLNDPASVDADIRDITLDLTNRAKRLGLQISNDRAADIATQALRNGWTVLGSTGWNLDGAEISAALGAEMQFAPGVEQVGTLGSIQDGIRELADDYLVTVSDQALFDMTRDVLSQTITMEGIEQQFQTRATARFPHLDDQIAAGTKPSSIFEDYRQLIQAELGEPAGTVDLVSDNRFSAMLSTADDKGGTRVMTIPEATSHLRNLGGTSGQWSRTPQAHERVSEFRSGIERIFGRR